MHRAKFKDVVDNALDLDIDIPERFAAYLDREKVATKMGKEYGGVAGEFAWEVI